MVNIDFATPEAAIVVPQIFTVSVDKLVGELGFSSGWPGRAW